MSCTAASTARPTRAGAVLLLRAHIAPDGTLRFEDGENMQLAPSPISGTFEFNDALHPGEKHGAEKLRSF